MNQLNLFTTRSLVSSVKPEPVARLPEKDILREAQAIYAKRMKITSAIESPEAATEFLKLSLSEREREVFAVLHLNTRHRVIHYEELFYGTIDGCTIHVREVVRSALLKNTAALIVSHNHPSQICEPSNADVALTKQLKEALDLVDIRLLDHVIVGGDSTVSLSSRGEL